MRKPPWAKHLDSVNYTVIGVILLVVIWETMTRVFP